MVWRILESKDAFAFSLLLKEGFEIQSGQFFDDFPVWNPEIYVKNRILFGAFEGEKLLCGGGGRLVSLTDSKICAGIIGAIVTHPDYRKRGLATQLLKDLENWIRLKGAKMAVLWGSEIEFYRSLGFDYFGLQGRVPLSQCLEEERKEFSLKVNEGWSRGIFALRSRRRMGIQLYPEDLAWYEAHLNVRWFSIGDPYRPLAYCALGRGIDLISQIHEWGGDSSALKILFQSLAQSHPGELSLIGPPQELSKLTDSCLIESLCIGKVWDPSLSPPKMHFGDPFNLSPSIPLWFWGLDSA